MTHALAIFLNQPFLNLEDSEHIVIPFPSQQEAEGFTVRMLKAAGEDIDESLPDDELLSDWQSGLGGSEYFHVYEIRSADSIRL